MATNQIDRKALSWVQSEIKQALGGARDALDLYVINSDQKEHLAKVKSHLHQVNGTLKMLGVYGAILLADEMLTLTEKLETQAISRKEDAFEVLMRAIIQLPTYLENLQQGQKDIPIVLLPMLNDIRAICGEGLLTEGAFFNPDLNVFPKKAPGGKNPKNAMAMSRKWRPVYQLSLVGIFRDTDVKDNIRRLAKIFVQLERTVCTRHEQQLWWVAGGVIEALYDSGLKVSESIRHLLGQYDRHLKLLAESGETKDADVSIPDLLKNSLYYVAQSNKRGKRVKELNKAFALDQVLPSESELNKAQDSLLGLDGNLMSDVAVAVKDNLLHIKETIDVYSRSSSKDITSLEPVLDKLKTVADTLGMLGFGQQRQDLVDHHQNIANAIKASSGISEAQIMELASCLLYVESSLSGSASDTTDGNVVPQSEYQDLVGITAAEARTVLGKVKDAVISFAADTSRNELLDTVADQTQSIAGAMTILNQEQGSALFKKLSGYITGNLQNPCIDTSPEELNALADIITGGEYFIDAVVDDPVGANNALHVMEDGLGKLNFDFAAPQVAAEPAPVPEKAAPQVAPAVLDDLADGIDEEVMEIFLEEVDEEAESVALNLAAWENNHNNDEALATLRRSFHTIKGSGRIVGANKIGEFAWSIENLLNRIMDKTYPPSDNLFTVLGRASQALPELITELKGEGEVSADIEGISSDADKLSKGEDIASLVEPVESPATELAEADSVPEAAEEPVAEDGIDPVLAEIFINETRNHLETIENFVSDCGNVTDPCRVNHALIRALHTLHGSANMAGIVWMVDLTDSLERFAKILMESEHRLPEDFIVLLSDSVPSIERLLETLNTNPEFPHQEELERRAMVFLEQGITEVSVDNVPESDIDANAGIILEAAEASEDLVSEPDQEEIPPTTEIVAGIALAEEEITLQPPVSEAEVDDELVGIFTEEATEILSDIENILDTWASEITNSSHISSLQRSLHTLKGGARMAGLTDVGDHTHEVETALEQVASANNPDELQECFYLVQTAYDWISTAIEQLKLGVVVARPTENAVTANTDAIEAEVEDTVVVEESFEQEPDAEILFEDSASAESEFWEPEKETPADTGFEDSIPDLGELEDDGLEEVLISDNSDLADTELVLEAPAQEADEVEELSDELIIDEENEVNQITLELAEDDVVDQPEPASMEMEPDLSLVEAQQEPQYDSDLLDVFIEEATEILETADDLLHGWAQNPRDKGLMLELQRALHTMKGGARMARVSPIGDLSHSIETALEAVEQGKIDNPDALVELVQSSYDWLSDAVEKIRETQPITTPEALINNIEVTAGLRQGELQALAQETVDVQEEQHEEEAAETQATQAELDGSVASLISNRVEPEQEETIKPAAVAAPVKQAGELVKIGSDMLENFINNAGEMSIYRSRMDQQLGTITHNLVELDHTVERIREQLKKFEIEAEAQILYRYDGASIDGINTDDFDPLEMDRFSNMQQLSRSLAETVGDLTSIQKLIYGQTRETEILLVQQSRVNSELQNGLMRTRLVPFSSIVPRLRRIVRQTSKEIGKDIDLKISGSEGEIDRTVLGHVNPAFEHMLRNAIDHGIENPAARRKAKKPETGSIKLDFGRSGGEVVITIEDDGKGMDLDAIRKKALQNGLMDKGADLSESEILQFVLEAGFSTADKVTQISGRGVGMDVVSTEIKQMGGTLQIATDKGKGSKFTVRLPLTVSVNQALIVSVGEEVYAIPLVNVVGVIRTNKEELERMQSGESTHYDYAGNSFKYFHLGSLMEICKPLVIGDKERIPLILARAGDHHVALQAEAILGRNEVVVKTVGPQISSVKGISGATIMGDGSVALILDIPNLIRSGFAHTAGVAREEDATKKSTLPVIMVVDDSITVRKVTERLLKRHNMEVVTAKDGVDALDQLQEFVPDLILSDIEMPRMDGYELITAVRKDDRLMDIPVIMITSRTGDKHKERAMNIGVDEYLGKPFQDTELLDHISRLLSENE